VTDARLVSEGGPWVAWQPQEGPAGPLSGTVLAVKDLIAVSGFTWAAGSRALAGRPAEESDAPVVAALRQAGCVVGGTVALHELAFGVSGLNDECGWPAHPDDPTRVPGGSSSGSAVAVADGSADVALGTDTGGSVRIPAALCGVVGFKPAYGTYPLDDVLPLAPSLDHVGLLAGSVAGVIRAHGVLTGEQVGLHTAPLRLGVDRAGVAAASAEVRAAVTAALDGLAAAGATLVDVDWPDADAVYDASTTILFAEAAEVHRALLASPEGALVGERTAERLRAGAAIAPAAVADARAVRAGLSTQVMNALTVPGLDAVVGPTVGIVAPTAERARTDPHLARELVAGTRLANLTRLPAITVPLRTPGLPIGLQASTTTNAAALSIAAALGATLP
jgi:Asp-tRNA(Asn)/Glu-tRNA(Gln) amidotransferase A subunit family amidase